MDVVARSEDEPARFACATKWTLGWLLYNNQALLNPGWPLVIDRDVYLLYSLYLYVKYDELTFKIWWQKSKV